MSYTPKQEARDLVEYADNLAELTLGNMEGEECVEMVREFCAVMADWQPHIRQNVDDPVALGLHCLAVAQVFRLAFVKGYTSTSKRIDAQNAIKKALGDL